jgi:hypothetical protein
MLNIYKEELDTSGIGEGNILYTTHNGKTGSWHLQKLYLRSDATDVQYNSITLSIDDTSDNGAVFQLYSGTYEPTLLEWGSLPYNNDIYLDDITSDDQYRAFWLRVFYPGDTPASKRTEGSINITAIESPI